LIVSFGIRPAGVILRRQAFRRAFSPARAGRFPPQSHGEHGMKRPPDSCSQHPPIDRSRRRVLRLLALCSLGLALPAAALAKPAQPGFGIRIPSKDDRTAGRWESWLAPSARGVRPPAPPSQASSLTRTELRELLDLQSRRSDATRAIVQFWDPQGGLLRWSQILLDKIKQNKVNPVRAARDLALFHTALADATTCAWDAKFAYNRPQPARLNRRIISLSQNDPQLPAYTSEHAAIGAAAATVLSYLFPAQTALVHGQTMTFDAIANEAALSRLWAGANYRSDLEAGIRIGQAIGWMAISRGQSDGSSAIWDPITQPGRLFGPQYWVPTPPGNVFPPLEPMAPFWTPWLLESPSQFRPPVPPALQGPFPSPQFLAETNEVKQTVDSLTEAQRTIALFWADDPGVTFTPPGHWAQVAAQQVAAAKLSTPRAARALALVAVGLADSAIACWDCKYAYWVLRPITAIRMLVGQPFYDPNFQTVITTPPFPSYISGHSTFSGCAAAVLEYLFPGGKVTDALGQSVTFSQAADQAAASRLYAGIHYRSDNEQGLVCGRHVAEMVIRRAQTDGAQ
jgi:membrane-associated phospholipid phosphatase